MSRSRPDAGEKIMLEYSCTKSFCRAPKGKWCVSKNGNIVVLLHSDRHYAATADGKLPLDLAKKVEE